MLSIRQSRPAPGIRQRRVQCSIKKFNLGWGQNLYFASLLLRQRILVMYHSTPDERSAESIEKNGFNISTGGNQMLGNGVYVSVDPKKCQNYGDIMFKLLVYPGRVCRITNQGTLAKLACSVLFARCILGRPTPPTPLGERQGKFRQTVGSLLGGSCYIWHRSI
jgi:hypothetical protein